jgi:hypothetical protein
MATETAMAGGSALVPRPEHRFRFGLWTVGHRGGDPFGDTTRPGLGPDGTVRRLAGLGAHGVCFHDNDLVPLGASEEEAREIKARFRRALDETGMQVTMGRYDQDFRFGAVGLKDAFFLVKPLEDADYDGPRHFDARPLRVENEDGIWDFAAGCMRTYLALAEKARRFDEDPDIRAARAEAKVAELARPTVESYSREAVDELLAEEHDLGALGARACRNERLDQLVIDLLLSLR